MKHIIRISVLMLGLVGTYASAATPKGPVPDGGIGSTRRPPQLTMLGK
jgi:hypothetical protein